MVELTWFVIGAVSGIAACVLFRDPVLAWIGGIVESNHRRKKR